MTNATDNKNNPFGDAEIISCYTWDDACADGTFVRVPENLQKEAGIKFPCAMTSNLYHSYINPEPMPSTQDETGRLWDLLNMFRFAIKKSQGNMLDFEVSFVQEDLKSKTVTIWATCEARSPQNPEPIITFMLPEDY